MSGAFVALWIVWFRNEICCSLLGGGEGGAGVTILLYICFWSYTGRCVLPPGVCVVFCSLSTIGGLLVRFLPVLPPCVG